MRGRRADVDLVEGRGIAEELRQQLLDHIIGVHLGEILRHLPLAEGVVERVVDELRLNSVARRHVTIDLERQRRAGVLLIGRDVAQFWQRFQLVEDLDRPGVELVEIGVLQRVLELGLGDARADGHVLRRLQVDAHARHLSELRTQSGDHLKGVRRRGPREASTG